MAASAVRVGAPTDVEDGHNVPVLVDAEADAITATSRDPVARIGRTQRLTEPLWVVTQSTVDEFPGRGGDLHRQFVGQGTASGSSQLDVVPHAAPVAR
jgi:hypothetical protein